MSPVIGHGLAAPMLAIQRGGLQDQIKEECRSFLTAMFPDPVTFGASWIRMRYYLYGSGSVNVQGKLRKKLDFYSIVTLKKLFTLKDRRKCGTSYGN